jgi:Zn finger protein HypA/HybF involved in hydrogenase expression
MKWFQCFNCRKLILIAEPAVQKCPSCASKNGTVITELEVERLATDMNYTKAGLPKK